MLNVEATEKELVDSNQLFASAVGESLVLSQNLEEMAENALDKYVGSAPVIAYNRPLFASYRDGIPTMNEEIYEGTEQLPQFSVAEPFEYSLAY